MRIHKWLLPASALYGMGVRLRNWLFEENILKSKSYREPVICLGNLTAGGTGKTPHTEYLIKLLQQNWKVGVLSRGYKRKSKGWVLADTVTPSEMIGDEPWQMKHKFPETTVAVCEKRVIGIDHMLQLPTGQRPQVILLDDAYQHRYVKPGINILLVDYHRLIIYDKLLPAGRLREPKEGKTRADIVIVTKCPKDLKPMSFRVLTRALNLFPYQQLYFTCLQYGNLKAIFNESTRRLDEIKPDEHILLVTGIASPEQMVEDLAPYSKNIISLEYSDHHQFNADDVEKINNTFAMMQTPRFIITTEKDATRLENIEGLSEDVKNNIYTLPVEVKVMLDQQEKFDEVIMSYVQKNSKNSTLTKEKNRKIQEAKKPTDSKEKPIRLPDNNDSQASKPPMKIRF